MHPITRKQSSGVQPLAGLNPRANEIVLAALKIDSQQARKAHLDDACGGDVELRLRTAFTCRAGCKERDVTKTVMPARSSGTLG
jgi:hypothetical protein